MWPDNMARRGAFAFVWGTWFILVGIDIGVVLAHGGRTLVADDYFLLPTMSDGHLSREILLQRLNDHWMPAVQVLTWLLRVLLGYSPQAVMIAGIALLAAATAGLQIAVARTRGSPHWQDATLPLILLSPGQSDNFVFAIQISFLLPAAVMVSLIALSIGLPEMITRSRMLALAALSFILPFCSAHGQLFSMPLALYFLLLSGSRRLSVTVRVIALMAALGIGSSLALALFEYQKPPDTRPPGVSPMSLRYAVRMIGSGWGMAGDQLGPQEPRPFPAYAGTITSILFAGAVFGLVRRWSRREDRSAAFAMLALGVSVLGVCAGIGIGRGDHNGGSLASRYITLATPLLAWVYVATVRFGTGNWAHAATWGMCLGAIALAWPNAIKGIALADVWGKRQSAIQSDLRRGVPMRFLAEHHGMYLMPPLPEQSAYYLNHLREGGHSPFDTILEPPVLEEQAIAWSVSIGPGAEPDQFVRIPLGEQLRGTITVSLPAKTKALQIQYVARGAVWVTKSKLWWDETNGTSATVRRTVFDFIDVRDQTRRLIWLGGPVASRIEFKVDGPVELKITSVTALVEP